MLLGSLAAAAPVAGQDAGTAASEVPTMPGRGTMDTDEVTLSGPDAPPPGPSGRSGPGAGAEPPAPGATGWTQVIDLLPGTEMVALSWDGTTSGPSGPASGRMSLRSRSDDGAWGEWSPLAPDEADHGGDAGVGRVGSDIVWLGSDGAAQIEVRIDAGPLVDLELLRMRYHEAEPVPAVSAARPTGRASGRAPQPTIRPRSAWATRGWASGQRGCGSAPSVASRLGHAVVHHSAGSNSYTQAQVPGLLDGIRQYHQSSLGWCDFAYNFAVDKFGGIWQGRDGDVAQPVISGATKGFNTGSASVVLLGQFEPGASPASAAAGATMLDSTARLLAWKLGLHGLDPDGTTTVTSYGSTRYSSGTRVALPVINPHRATSTTSCPGGNVAAELASLRAETADYMSTGGGGDSGDDGDERNDDVPADWTPFDSPEALVYRQYVDFLRNPGTYEGRLWWHQSLREGTTNRNALVVSLLSSGRLQDRSASSVRLYLAYFGRTPDHAGLRFWWGEMDRGKGIRDVSTSFARSPEFTARYGSLSDRDFVDLVYRNVLGRAPDRAGYDYWTARLQARRESRGGLVVLFSESAEYRIQRRDVVDVVVAHEAMLQRGISTSSALRWAARVADDRGALVSNLFSSAEYADRFR